MPLEPNDGGRTHPGSRAGGRFAAPYASIILTVCLMGVSACRAPDKGLVVTLSRSPCLGPCPVYDASLYEDGTLVYEGRRFVQLEGRRTKNVGADTVVRVKRALDDGGVRGLSWWCCNCQEATDSSTVVIGFHGSFWWKTINHYHGCSKAPRWLSAFEDSLDDLLGTAEFTGRKRPR